MGLLYIQVLALSYKLLHFDKSVCFSWGLFDISTKELTAVILLWKWNAISSLDFFSVASVFWSDFFFCALFFFSLPAYSLYEEFSWLSVIAFFVVFIFSWTIEFLQNAWQISFPKSVIYLMISQSYNASCIVFPYRSCKCYHFMTYVS